LIALQLNANRLSTLFYLLFLFIQILSVGLPGKKNKKNISPGIDIVYSLL